MEKCAFYQCYKCKTPYFGGHVECEESLSIRDVRYKDDLLCKRCALERFPQFQLKCDHGIEFISWKCHFCCNEATYFCLGNTYFCDDHHIYLMESRVKDCEGGEDCELGLN